MYTLQIPIHRGALLHDYYQIRIHEGEFHFFKQKTAYEILRSDWSSDVCSSD
eukprot:COSAG01_NODE_18139_length_1098_cov_0.768769_1_plen_51_part_10